IDPRAERLGDFAVDGVIRNVPAAAVVRARGASFEAEADFGVARQADRGAAALDEELRAKLGAMIEPLAARDPPWEARPAEIAALVGGLAEVPDARAVGALLRPPR